jgi:hypothetical protein
MDIKAMDHQPMPRHSMLLLPMPFGEGTQVRESMVKDFIILILIMVIVKFLFFSDSTMIGCNMQ